MSSLTQIVPNDPQASGGAAKGGTGGAGEGGGAAEGGRGGGRFERDYRELIGLLRDSCSGLLLDIFPPEIHSPYPVSACACVCVCQCGVVMNEYCINDEWAS